MRRTSNAAPTRGHSGPATQRPQVSQRQACWDGAFGLQIGMKAPSGFGLRWPHQPHLSAQLPTGTLRTSDTAPTSITAVGVSPIKAPRRPPYDFRRCPPLRPASPESGITLMEVLVAITLLSLLSVGILFATRIGLSAMERSKDRLHSNRRVLGVERILTQQIAGFIPVKADCFTNPQTPPARLPLFQGEPLTMRFVSTYSLNEASRGYPRLLEFQVIPGQDGEGVRLVVNELLYSGPLSAGVVCAGVVHDPGGSGPQMIFRPVQITPASFVLADRLASCRFLYKEEREFPQPDLWYERWTRPRPPNAVRIDMAPLSTDPSRLEVPTIVAPIRVTRDPDMNYVDVEPE